MVCDLIAEGGRKRTKSIIENTEMILSEKETSEFTMEKDNLFSKNMVK